LSYGRIIRKDINTTNGLLPASFDTYQIVEPGNIVLRLTDLQNDHKSLRVGLSTEEGIITSAYLALEPRQSIKPEYLYLFLHTADIHKYFYSLGSGIRQNLNFAGLRDIMVALPPVEEQEAIVEFLDSKTLKIDSYVAERERELAALEELRQAEIAHAVTNGLRPDVPMRDSGIPWLGKIPAHWKTKRMAILFSENTKKNDDYIFDHALKFNYGTLVPKDEQGDVSDLKETYLGYTLVNKGDIAINGLNLNYDFVSQRVALSPTDGIITSAYLILKPRHNTNSEYFTLLFKAMDAMKLFHGMGTGIRLTLSYDELKKQILPIPPAEEQQAIVDYINAKTAKIDGLIADLSAQIEKLKEYKQRLIADAVTGQIDVRK
jgi:type I restriction enzyme S subunit